jgi:hypothetical protein
VSWNFLRGIGGDFEITRVLGASGVAIYIIGANGFEAYEVFWAHKAFDLVAYCAAFPTGLGVAIAAIAGAASVKDRNVAVAKTVQDTGAMPTQSTPAQPLPPPPPPPPPPTGPAMPEPK